MAITDFEREMKKKLFSSFCIELSALQASMYGELIYTKGRFSENLNLPTLILKIILKSEITQ